MSAIRLSYILTTYNKLQYLQHTLPLLIAAKQADEEIVVVDGGSTDGAADYLAGLHREKKIDQFISEKDFGESHGTNKAILLSKGELIKTVTDDDIYDFAVVRHCREFMLKHPQIDILGAEGYTFNMRLSGHFAKSNFAESFKKWKQSHRPFLFCGLSFMIRRTSLPYLGLFNPHYTIVDMEYSARVSAMKTKIAFYPGVMFVNIVNPDSNSQKFYNVIRKERAQLDHLYPALKQDFAINRPIIRIKDSLGGLKKKIVKADPSKSVRFIYSDIVERALKKLAESTGRMEVLS